MLSWAARITTRLKENLNHCPSEQTLSSHDKKDLEAPGCIVLHDIRPAIEIARNNGEKECFIIGGSEIYKLAMPFTTRLYLTEIDAVIEGDTFFPEIDKNEWKEVSRVHHSADERHKYAFDIVRYDKL